MKLDAHTKHAIEQLLIDELAWSTRPLGHLQELLLTTGRIITSFRRAGHFAFPEAFYYGWHYQGPT